MTVYPSGGSGTAANGLPTGGTAGQVLEKNSPTNFDASWLPAPAAPNGLPTGGTATQVLQKNSATNYDASFVNIPNAPNGLPTGGTATQILQKNSATNYDASFVAIPNAPNGTPTGGAQGQTLIKNSATNYDDLWTNLTYRFPYTISGTVAVATGASRMWIDRSYKILGTMALINTAPTGSTLIVDVLKNGSTIYTTTANRPTIPISGNSSQAFATPDVTALALNDYLTVNISQVGSTVAGSDLTIVVLVALVS